MVPYRREFRRTVTIDPPINTVIAVSTLATIVMRNAMTAKRPKLPNVDP